VAPPPSLSARLHVACGLAANAPGQTFVPTAQDELLLEETLFEAARGLEPEPFVPALRAFFEEAAPPADLRKRILQSTVEAAARQRVLHSQDKALPLARDLGQTLRGWLMPLRWAGAATVPALAAWLLLMARAPQTTLPAPHLPDTSTSPVVARVAKTIPAPVRVARPAVSPSVAPRLAAAPPAPRVTVASSASTSISPPLSSRDMDEVPQIETPDIDPRPLPRTAALSVEAGIIPQFKQAIQTGKAWIKHQTPRITMVSLTKRSERADVENGPGSIHSAARFSPLPTAPEASERPVRIAATFQEALADFGSLRNYGIAELNGVVDDYRAALSSDQNDDADAQADNDDDDDQM
jgi:hypothetical protein